MRETASVVELSAEGKSGLELDVTLFSNGTQRTKVYNTCD